MLEERDLHGVFRVSLPEIELSAPLDCFDSEDALKEWAWEHHKETFRASMTVRYKKQEEQEEDVSEEGELGRTEQDTVEQDPIAKADLLDCISKVQRQFFQRESAKVVFGGLLDSILELTESEYGFIGEIKHEEDTGAMYLQTHAITNIAWNQATQKFYEDNIQAGLRFSNLNTLFGTVMTTAEPLIANNPAKHPRRGGLPEGHPPLNHFLGVPFFKNGDELVGMVGISNKPGGYSQKDIDFMEPLTVTCSNLISAYNQIEHNNFLINNLENSVKARTRELELANASLEEANHRVKQTAQMQLQHFACMSHEIRTPLNCIIGMSSVLKETQMTGMQEETMQMIIESGDLLAAIIDDVLDYSKLETGNFDLEIRKCDLQLTLNSILHSIEMKAQSRSQSVLQHYDTTLPRYLHLDSRRTQQILFNLLGNAIKFSKDNAAVEFTVQYLPVTNSVSEAEAVDRSETSKCGTFTNILDGESPVPLSKVSRHDPSATTNGNQNICGSGCFSDGTAACTQDNGGSSKCPFQSEVALSAESLDATEQATKVAPDENAGHPGNETCCSPCVCCAQHMLRFVVKDYGRGIPKQDFDRIFRPFQQASGNEPDNVTAGTGLGLAITHRLVSAMGGVISVDSEFGAWSEFTVDLPCFDPPADVTSIKTQMRNCTVIVVGVPAPEKACALEIFASYDVQCFMFDSMLEMKTKFLQQNKVSKDRTYVCLFGEDAFDEDDEPYKILSGKAKTTLLTSGPKFSRGSTHHIRSLIKIIPLALMETLLESTLEAQPSLPEDVAEAGVPYERIRVLVAEDLKMNQRVLQRMLTRLGLKHIDFADNGVEAVEKEAASPYDIILMDQQMPLMGGVVACRHIVNRTGGHPIPKIVFVTAHVSADFEAECRDAGSSDFLPKPFKIEQIKACFEKHFGGS